MTKKTTANPQTTSIEPIKGTFEKPGFFEEFLGSQICEKASVVKSTRLEANLDNNKITEKDVLIAKVIAPHGVRGDVKLLIFCENIANLERYPLTDSKGGEIKIRLKGGKKAKPIGFSAAGDKIALATFDGISDRNAALLKVGLEIFTARQNFPPLKKNEFYLSDLIGLKVLDKSRNCLGKIVNSQQNSSLTSLEIEFEDAALKFLPPLYSKLEAIPFKDEFFPDIEIENGTITLVPPKFEELEEE